MQSFRISRALSRVIGTRNTQRWKQCRFSIMETMKNWSMIFTALRTERFISWQPFWGGVLRCRCRDNDTNTDHRDLLSNVTIEWETVWGWHAQIKKFNPVFFMNGICQGRLSLFVDGCRPQVFVVVFPCFVRHAWCSESVRVDWCAWCAVPFVGARDSSVRCVQGSSQFAFR